jgi:hypothetical protein
MRLVVADFFDESRQGSVDLLFRAVKVALVTMASCESSW